MKPSSLTRSVFRAIIANRPYRVAECCRHSSQIRPCRSPLSTVPLVQRRGLLTAILGTGSRGFQGAKNTPRNIELAFGKLVDLLRAQRTSSRPPPEGELIDAFKFIFSARLESHRNLTRNEVYLLSEAFKYFQANGLINEGSSKPSLKKEDLNTMLTTLALPSSRDKFRSDTSALARLVFQAIELEPSSHGGALTKPTTLMPIYISVLCSTGSAHEAMDLLLANQVSNVVHNVRVWIDLLKGLQAENLQPEHASAFDRLCEHLPAFSQLEFEQLMIYLMSTKRLEGAKRVWEIQRQSGIEPTTKQLQQSVRYCAYANDIKWGQQFYDAIRSRHEHDVLGTIFVWLAARQTDTSVVISELEGIINATSGDLSVEPFNNLLEYALQTGRTDLASATMEVADHLDLPPNGKTYVLYLKNALNRGDLVKAEEMYEHLIREDIPSDHSDQPALNKFAAGLAFAPSTNYALLMQVVDTLLERNADFDAETLAGLCKVFLNRDELEDLTGILRHRADFYPGPDRARISAVFQEFILDMEVKDQRAYNAYDLFRHAFPETSVEQRLPLMQSFFDRKRPDLACLVFGHMRQREDAEARPTPAAYAQCFAGIAQCRDVDGLQMVYNMLKLDLEVDPRTRIRNGLMLAYIACQMPFTAMIDHFWKIMDSKEGPSYSTFEIGLRACETWVPVGGHEARKIIAIMQAWNLEITKELYECYIGAIAGQSEFEYTVELIEEMQKEIGVAPDAVTIGTFYNAIPWQYRKDEVEKWAKQAYPDLWEDLLRFGDEIDEEWEIRYFKIDRTIPIDDDPLFETGRYDPQIARQAVKAMEPTNEPKAKDEDS